MIQYNHRQPGERQKSQIDEYMLEFLDRHYRICLETITYCLFKGGGYAAEKQIRRLQDCAEICKTAANFMIRNSYIRPTICNACADICLRCAEECEMLINDKFMVACADACRRCARFCEILVADAAKSIRGREIW
jgi:Domain of Unknown Function (DUF326)